MLRQCVKILITSCVCFVLSLAQGGNVTATIYVGRHFEVREHNQPTKYVFSGTTRLAEITGSLAMNQRLQRLRLYPGWNLCSVAVSGPFPTVGGEAIAAAYEWHPGTGDYSQVTLGQTLAAGTVLWLKASTNAVVSVLGAYTAPDTRLVQAGGTYLAGAGLEAWSPTPPDLASSWVFDAGAAQWSEHLPADLADVSSPAPILSPGAAMYIEAAAPASIEGTDPNLRIRYYHQDHLGSSSAIADANGEMIEETAYFPFGSSRNEFQPRSIEEPYSFTQKERDQESRLHCFEARYLTAPLSRFALVDQKYANPDLLAPETLRAVLSQPQENNLYAYAKNNPIRFYDPSGHDVAAAGIQLQGNAEGNTGSLECGVVAYGWKPWNWGVYCTAGAGVGTPGASGTANVNYNPGGRSDFEGQMTTCELSGGEEVVASGSYSEGTGKPTYSLGVGLGGGSPVGLTCKETYTVSLTVKDVAGAVFAPIDPKKLIEKYAPPQSVANMDYATPEETSVRFYSTAQNDPPPPPPPRPQPRPARQQTIRPPSHYYSRPIVETKSPVTADDFGYDNRHWGENRLP